MLWDEQNVGLKCQTVRRDIVFLASNSLHNLGSQNLSCPCYHPKNFEQIHWSKLFCKMYGLPVMLSISTWTNSKNINKMNPRIFLRQIYIKIDIIDKTRRAERLSGCWQNGSPCLNLNQLPAKGDFFSERAIRFSNLQNKNIPKNYPELEI